LTSGFFEKRNTNPLAGPLKDKTELHPSHAINVLSVRSIKPTTINDTLASNVMCINTPRWKGLSNFMTEWTMIQNYDLHAFHQFSIALTNFFPDHHHAC
jgi:hypothetical protein